MVVNSSYINFSDLADNYNLRLYNIFKNPETFQGVVRLLDCIEPVECGCRPKGGIVYFEDDYYAISLGGEQIGKNGRVDLSNMPTVPIEYYYSTSKGKVKQNDILICKDGALTGKSCIVDISFPVNEVMVNEHVFIIRSNGTFPQILLHYLIRSDFVQGQIKDLAYRKKGQPGLNIDHLSKIKIPVISKELQAAILEKIATSEKEIAELRSTIIKPNGIIDNVFRDVFGLISADILAVGSTTEYITKLSDIAVGNINIRNSFRWNKMRHIQNFLYKDISCIKQLGHYIIETKNGWSPASVEDGSGIPVLGQEHFSFEGVLNVSPTKYTKEIKNNIEDFFIQKGDFFVSRGNTVDLVALASVVVGDIFENTIYPDLYIRIKFDEDVIDKQYLALLFNSFFGRLYFKYASKGKNQSMVKISSNELHDFLLPIPKKDIQKQVVSSIQVEIKQQNNIIELIKTKQGDLSKRIEELIFSPLACESENNLGA